MSEAWWKPVPDGIKMSDARARALLNSIADPENNDEWVFVQANSSTDIPPVTIKIVPPHTGLSLHHPRDDAPMTIGEGDN